MMCLRHHAVYFDIGYGGEEDILYIGKATVGLAVMACYWIISIICRELHWNTIPTPFPPSLQKNSSRRFWYICRSTLNEYVSLLIPERPGWCIVFTLSLVVGFERICQRFFATRGNLYVRVISVK